MSIDKKTQCHTNINFLQIHKFNVLPIKIPVEYFVELDKLIL